VCIRLLTAVRTHLRTLLPPVYLSVCTMTTKWAPRAHSVVVAHVLSFLHLPLFRYHLDPSYALTVASPVCLPNTSVCSIREIINKSIILELKQTEEDKALKRKKHKKKHTDIVCGQTGHDHERVNYPCTLERYLPVQKAVPVPPGYSGTGYPYPRVRKPAGFPTCTACGFQVYLEPVGSLSPGLCFLSSSLHSLNYMFYFYFFFTYFTSSFLLY
jgi:hypothetical protein